MTKKRLQKSHIVSLLYDDRLGKVVGHTKGGAAIVKWQGKGRKCIHNPRYLRRIEGWEGGNDE